MPRINLLASCLAETDMIGNSLASHLPDGITISLNGPLGAGKTRLVQAIAVGCEIPVSSVLSPTFVLCRNYQGQRTISHLDAYRIQDDDEFWELGVEEYFGISGITLVEWGDRVANCLPVTRIDLSITILDDDSRQFELVSDHPNFEDVRVGLLKDCPQLLETGDA